MRLLSFAHRWLTVLRHRRRACRTSGVASLALLGVLAAHDSLQAQAEPGGGWHISTQPEVVIGAPDGPPESALHLVRTAVRLSDGRIVVADGGLASRLRVFSPGGAFLGEIGGPGDGPGEFRWITSLQVVPGDSLFVFDEQQQRLTAMLADGDVIRTTPIRIPVINTGGPLSSLRRLADHRWVGRSSEARVRRGAPGQFLRDTVVVGLIDDGLEEMTPLTALPGRWSTTNLVAGRRSFRTSPFSPKVSVAEWGRCAFVSATGAPEIFVYSANGDLLQAIPGPGAPRRITEGHLETRLEWELTRVPAEEEPIRRTVLRREARPEHLPYYHQTLVDEWGDIWLQEFEPPLGPSRRWYVVSQFGEHLETVEMPAPMQVFSITQEGVLGQVFGGLDEQLVVSFPLDRPERRSPDVQPRCVAS